MNTQKEKKKVCLVSLSATQASAASGVRRHGTLSLCAHLETTLQNSFCLLNVTLVEILADMWLGRPIDCVRQHQPTPSSR